MQREIQCNEYRLRRVVLCPILQNRVVTRRGMHTKAFFSTCLEADRRSHCFFSVTNS